MAEYSINVVAVSRFYATPCFPAGAGPDYVNAALNVEITMSASDLLAALHRLENRFGRARSQRWGMRTLDLDLLAFDDAVHPDLPTYLGWRDLSGDIQRVRAPEEMILPHPRLHERAFVLVPLADVAPGWVHPVLRRSVAQMLDDLPPQDRAGVVPIVGPDVGEASDFALVKPAPTL